MRRKVQSFYEQMRLKWRLRKSPAFRVIFRNKQGKVINEDVYGEGFGTIFTGLTINAL